MWNLAASYGFTSLLLALTALPLIAQTALAAVDFEGTSATFAWSAASGPVVGYEVQVSRNGGAFASEATTPDSPREVSVAGFIGDTIAVRVRGFDLDANFGPFSQISASVRFVSSPAPDPPPPPPPTGGPQAQVVGFALWDAQNDTLIDGNFQDGEQIMLATNGCTAIEILGNAYLNGSGPGSVKKVFDGQDPGACNDPGVSHDNSAPYAWEADEGPGQFGCAATLTQAGAHVLTVTPFEGNDCTGEQGTPMTLQFIVVGAPDPPPPPPEPLGQPGQPQLIIP